jgi:hypothetical protein
MAYYSPSPVAAGAVQSRAYGGTYGVGGPLCPGTGFPFF